MKTGIGYDIHPLVQGRRLVLGGVEIDFILGLDGHSDADVVVHSICDAILGAASLGDIGKHFPSSDESLKGISSLKLLRKVDGKIKAVNYEVNNIDVTIICEKPNLSGYIKKMCKNICDTLKVPIYDVNIKATTNKKIGPIGEGSAIASLAVATIVPTVNR